MEMFTRSSDVVVIADRTAYDVAYGILANYYQTAWFRLQVDERLVSTNTAKCPAYMRGQLPAV